MNEKAYNTILVYHPILPVDDRVRAAYRSCCINRRDHGSICFYAKSDGRLLTTMEWREADHGNLEQAARDYYLTNKHFFEGRLASIS